MLFAAVAHAAWNALLKHSSDQLVTLAGLRLVGLPVAIALLSIFPWPSSTAVPYLIGNVLFMYAYYFFLLNSYRVGDFSAVYPIARGIAPIVVLGAAYFWGTDALRTTDLLATVTISAGIALFAGQQQVKRSAAGYAMATGLMIAGYTLLAGMGVRQSGSTLGYLAWSELLAGLGLIPVACLLRSKQLKPYLTTEWRHILFAGFLSVSAFGLVLWVFNFLPLGPVTAVRESSVAFAVVFGVFFLKEPMNATKGIALTLVLLGTTMLAL